MGLVFAFHSKRSALLDGGGAPCVVLLRLVGGRGWGGYRRTGQGAREP
jgi:hypothetical protein